MKLENISTMSLVGMNSLSKNGCNERRNFIISRHNAKIIIDKNLNDYQKLKNYYENNNNEFCKTDLLEQELNNVIKTVEKHNYIMPNIFNLPNSYESLSFDQRITDKNTDTLNLLSSNPYGIYENIKSYSIQLPSIYILKEMLSHCDYDGRNLFSKKTGIYDIKFIEYLLKIIDLYDKQVLRQHKENQELNLNPKYIFIANRDEKKELIKRDIIDIVNYLLVNAKVLIWGDETTSERNILYDLAYKNNQHSKNLREMLATKLAYYSSLEECKKGLTKTRAMKRFILE